MKSDIKKKKHHPILTAFATSLTVSLAFFIALVAINIDLVVSEYFGGNPCAMDSVSLKGMWNNPGNSKTNSQSFSDFLDDTVFIGDSRTVGLKTYRFIKPEKVFAKVSQTHQSALTEHFVDLGKGKLLTVAEAVKQTKPERMIVSYGINSMSTGKDLFIKKYEELVDQIRLASPDSEIVIQSILPVSYVKQVENPNLANSKIDSYNKLLKAMAEKKSCKYLDTSNVLKNSKNCLSSEYDSGDGLHFNSKAYIALLQYLDQSRI